MMFKRYDSAALSKFVTHMLRSKQEGGEFQRQLLTAAKDNGEFVRFFEGNLKEICRCENIFEGSDEPPLLSLSPDRRLSESSFINPPLDLMEIMADTWRAFEKRDAGDPCLWAYINIRMVEAGLINSAGLAKDNGNYESGATSIDKALRETKQEVMQKKKPELDKTSRRLIRQLCGHPNIRGIREMYQHCGPVRAWWTYRIAEEAANATGEDGKKFLGVLREKTLWTEFSEEIISRRTVMGDVNIRNGLLLFWCEQDSESDLYKKGNTLAQLFRQIGRMSSWRALGYFDCRKVCDVIRAEIVPLIPKGGK